MRPLVCGALTPAIVLSPSSRQPAWAFALTLASGCVAAMTCILLLAFIPAQNNIFQQTAWHKEYVFTVSWESEGVGTKKAPKRETTIHPMTKRSSLDPNTLREGSPMISKQSALHLAPDSAESREKASRTAQNPPLPIPRPKNIPRQQLIQESAENLKTGQGKTDIPVSFQGGSPGTNAATRTALQTQGRPGESEVLKKRTYRPAKIIESSRISYPLSAKKQGKQGDVLLDVVIDEKAKIIAIAIHQSSGSEQLDKAAISGVQKWKFSPAFEGGKAISTHLRLPIHFRLE